MLLWLGSAKQLFTEGRMERTEPGEEDDGVTPGAGDRHRVELQITETPYNSDGCFARPLPSALAALREPRRLRELLGYRRRADLRMVRLLHVSVSQVSLA